MHCICKCIKGSGKPTTKKRKNGKKRKIQIYKSAFSKQSKSDDDKTDGTQCGMAFIYFFIYFFSFFFSYREKVLFAVSSVVVAVVVVVFAFGVSLLLLPLFDTAMKRNAHAKEVAN